MGAPWIRYDATRTEEPMRRPPAQPGKTRLVFHANSYYLAPTHAHTCQRPYDSVVGECSAKGGSVEFREYIVESKSSTYGTRFVCLSYILFQRCTTVARFTPNTLYGSNILREKEDAMNCIKHFVVV